jgi:hypothetical protein
MMFGIVIWTLQITNQIVINSGKNGQKIGQMMATTAVTRSNCLACRHHGSPTNAFRGERGHVWCRSAVATTGASGTT